MESSSKWYFTKDQLANTPSRRLNIDENKELSYRQQASHFIQDMGQRLHVSQLCINTAIVYMHRFYVFHAFSEVHRNSISVAALFLAAKVEEQPRKLEHVIKVAHLCLHKDGLHMDVRTDAYAEKQLEVVAHENVLLQTLGFVLAIEHPHTYVVKVCQLVKASKDLAQTSYFMATTSLHMTTMCLQYKPTVVACVCIHLACKWSNWKIEPCSEGKEWYFYVDKSVTLELLEALTKEFIAIMETSPHRFKRRFISHKDGGYHGPKNILDDVAISGRSCFSESKIGIAKKDFSSPGPSSTISFNFNDFDEKPSDSDTSEKTEMTPASSTPTSPKKVKQETSPTKKIKVESSPSKKVKPEPSHSISLAVYREKREKERQTDRKNTSAITSETFKEKESKHVPAEKLPPALNDKEKMYLLHNTKRIEHGHNTSKEKAGKINHTKDIMPPAPSLSQKPNKILKIPSDSNSSKETKHLVNNEMKNVKISKGPPDPFVLLTRVDEGDIGKLVSQNSDSQNVEKQNLVVQSSSNFLDEKFKLKNSIKPKVSVLDTSSEILCDIKTSLRTTDTLVAKPKHQKHKVNLLHNNHSNILQITQGDPQRLSPSLDSIKANGSKETDAVDSQRRSLLENNIEITKNPELSNSRHERREKHKHKHSSSRDKTANHHLVTPMADVPGGGIKITIPKDKICLRSESSQKPHVSGRSESPKKSLKIKIPKPPPKEILNAGVKTNMSGSGLKLVLTKDKSGSGSYSTSHKSDRESRKRPMNQSHVNQDHHMKNSHDHVSGRPLKISKIDTALYKSHHIDGANASSKHLKIARHNAHHGIPEQLVSKEVGGIRMQVNDGAQLNLVIPYGGQPPPPPYSQMYSYHNAPPHRHMLPSVKTNSNPPLPPPLPPQPPPPPPE